MPGHEDMQQMLAAILVVAEPLMAMIVAYCVVQFSFSRIAQDLGSWSWFIGVVAVPCIYTFIVSVLRLLPPRWTFCVDSMFYSPVLWLIVQPVTVYLAISLFRRLVILKKRGGTR
ncbi:unknown [Bacteroides sp. CAG:770]|nr:unknown [Bacteroides sp. CAG:770]